MPTKHARINIVRDPGLDTRIAALSSYAACHNLQRDSDIVRAMIDAGYDELRRRELQEAVARNVGIEDEGVGDAAALSLAKDGLSDS